MNFNSVKIASLATMFMSVLLLLGIAGAVSPAFAAGEIIINSNAPVTNYRQVTLTLAPPAGSATMSFRNESGSWSIPADPVAATKAWTLSTPDGKKTVSVQFKNSSGVTLGIFSNTIVLDYIIDTSFSSPKGFINYGNTGLNKTSGRSVAVQPDQKIVVVGTLDNGGGNSELEVIRYNPDGTFDTTFGVPTGRVHYGNTSGSFTGNGVAIQPDGKIVVVGTYDMGAGKTGLWLLRLTSAGALDPDFNTGLGGGYLVLGGPGKNSGNAVALDANGRIVVVGTYDNGGTNNTTPWVLRFNGDGSPDTLFNGTGDVVITAAAGAHTGKAVALDGTGNIVVVGTYDHADGNTSVWALKLNSTGQLRNAFGGRGTGENTFGYYGAHSGSAVAINPTTGKIDIVGTYDWTGGDTDLWLLQLDSDGILDATFNPNAGGIPAGTVALGGSGADSGSAVTIDAAGRIVVVGTYDNGSGNTSLLVQRITGAGVYDTTFNRGNSSYQFGLTGKFAGQGVALQADGKILVAGMGDNLAGTSSILALRLHDHTEPLTISITGSGTVAALPGDITWAGSIGSGNYIQDTVVQLTATPGAGASFSGWSGCDFTSGTLNEICTVTMDDAENVTAAFTQFFPLTVSVTGVGTVSGSPGSISCNSASGPGCSESFTAGTVVTLTATPTWYTLNGLWSGACSGSITTACTVTMDVIRNVTATFISNMNARVVGWGDYPTLTEAYSVANTSGPDATIQAKDSTQVVFQEAPLEFNLPVIVTFQGGKGSDFSAPAVGFTSVIGPLNISNGRLNASNLKVKHP